MTDQATTWFAIHGLRKMGLKRVMCIALLTTEGIFLAHITDQKIAAAAKEAAANAKGGGGGFLAQLQATAGAGQELIDKYQAMSIEALAADDPRNGLIPYDSIKTIAFKPTQVVRRGSFTQNLAGHLEIGTDTAEFQMHLLSYPDADGAARDQLKATFGERLEYDAGDQG